MTDEIRPALTPEEWKERQCKQASELLSAIGLRVLDDWSAWNEGEGLLFFEPDERFLYVTYDSGVIEQRVPTRELPVAVALANHALPDGHPLKLTREDVAMARREGAALTAWAHDCDTDAERLEWTARGFALIRLADKLAALLPPEETH